jgi:hypothetical protein
MDRDNILLGRLREECVSQADGRHQDPVRLQAAEHIEALYEERRQTDAAATIARLRRERDEYLLEVDGRKEDIADLRQELATAEAERDEARADLEASAEYESKQDDKIALLEQYNSVSESKRAALRAEVEAWEQVGNASAAADPMRPSPSPAAALVQVNAIRDANRDLRAKVERLTAGQSEGARRIVAERSRQIVEEGWTPEHDDQHQWGELAKEAASLAVYGTDAYVVDPDGDHGSLDVHDAAGDLWGLQKKHGMDAPRALEIAGALIVAELDRVLRRAALAEGQDEEAGRVIDALGVIADRASPAEGEVTVDTCATCEDFEDAENFCNHHMASREPTSWCSAFSEDIIRELARKQLGEKEGGA